MRVEDDRSELDEGVQPGCDGPMETADNLGNFRWYRLGRVWPNPIHAAIGSLLAGAFATLLCRSDL